MKRRDRKEREGKGRKNRIFLDLGLKKSNKSLLDGGKDNPLNGQRSDKPILNLGIEKMTTTEDNTAKFKQAKAQSSHTPHPQVR